MTAPQEPLALARRRQILRWTLLTAIVLASAFLSWWTFRTSAALERLGERSIIESTVLLVREKIDRVEALIIGGDNAVLHLVNPDDLDVVASRWPDLAERISPAAWTVLVLDEAQRPLRVVARGGDGDARRFRAFFEERLRAELRLQDETVGAYKHWHGALGGQNALVSYATREVAGRRYYVVIEIDLDYVRREVLPKLFDDPLARGRFNITDESNRLVYGRQLTAAGDFLVSMRFPTTLYKWRLAVAPRQAPELESRARNRRVAEGFFVTVALGVILAGVLFLLYAVRQEERLNRLKSDFIATVSHELKTPLALIRMFGEMLASERVATPEKRRHYLDVIVRESERLTSLIENVLDFARLERGKASFEFATGDLGAVVLRDVDLFRHRMQRDRPALVTDLAADLRPVRFDERAVQLMLFNLLDNACKYAGDGATITVRLRGDARRVTLEVEDEGPGIDPDDARRIFERFYRGKAARTGQARGSGIGLSLVKHIARAHGGDVTLRPRVGGGSVFVVTIPTAEPASE